jgi:putative membrane protein
LFFSLSKTSRKKDIPEYTGLLKILKEKYAMGEISSDEYRERTMILDDEYLDTDYWMYEDNSEMMLLKEKYAKCEVNSREYIERRDDIIRKRNSSGLDILKERYAKGEISFDEFKLMKKTLR